LVYSSIEGGLARVCKHKQPKTQWLKLIERVYTGLNHLIFNRINSGNIMSSITPISSPDTVPPKVRKIKTKKISGTNPAPDAKSKGENKTRKDSTINDADPFIVTSEVEVKLRQQSDAE
jgi:hypothetical protein